MSRSRTIVGLLVGIAAAAAVHFALDVQTNNAPRALRRNALVPAAGNATAFSVARAGEPVTRLAHADGWKIVAPYVASAEPSVVLRFADALAYAPISDEMTDAELLRLGRTREDFGLDRPRVVVTVGDSGSGGTTVSFGAATPAGDGVYATVGESATVYVVASNVFSAVDQSVLGFRRRRVFAVGQEDVAAFDIKCGTGRFSRFSRAGEIWRQTEPHDNTASSSRIQEFLGELTKLEAQGFVWPVGVSNETAVASVSLLAGYGLDPESSVTVVLKDHDGKDGMISFGRESGKGSVYALVLGGSAIVSVPSAVRDAAVAGAQSFVDTRLFPVEPSAVGAISLDDGSTVHLLARGADGAWRLDAPVSAAADQPAVDALVQRMLSLRASDVVADGIRVSIGTNAEPVSVSRAALLADMRLEDLRSREILRIDPKLVKRVVVAEDGKKPTAVIYDADRKVWAVESSETVATADGAAVGALVAALAPLQSVRVERLKVSASELGVYGLDKPFRTVAVDQTAEDAVRRNVLVGDVTDGGRFATLGSSDAVFVISSESAAALTAPIVR